MNYNGKDKNDKIELDELKIKSHLNTSLDLIGISVSEDLINRTLAAIKEQALSGEDEVTQTSIMKPTKKIIAWNRYIRGFAGVAAAAPTGSAAVMKPAVKGKADRPLITSRRFIIDGQINIRYRRYSPFQPENLLELLLLQPLP